MDGANLTLRQDVERKEGGDCAADLVRLANAAGQKICPPTAPMAFDRMISEAAQSSAERTQTRNAAAAPVAKQGRRSMFKARGLRATRQRLGLAKLLLSK